MGIDGRSLTHICSLFSARGNTIGWLMKTEAQKIVQAMSPAQKLRAAERLYLSTRQLKAAALRAQHPDWTEEAIRQAVRQIFLYARN